MKKISFQKKTIKFLVVFRTNMIFLSVIQTFLIFFCIDMYRIFVLKRKY